MTMVFNRTKLNDRKGERGSITIMTAIFSLLLLLMVGLTIDVSRIYMVRQELQRAADAAALTAARELNGGTQGIDDAVTQATNVIANDQGLRAKTNVAITSVEFAANLNDNPYLSAAAAKTVASTIRFVKVTTASSSTSILFASSALGVSQTESKQAVAGMSVELAGICDFYPAAVGLNNPNPTAGTLMTLKFAQGSGNSAVINDMDYIVLDVPCITGNGDTETARLAAGEPCACNSLGGNIHMTPSSNFGNGGSAAGDGMNTRFGDYANGYGNSLTAANYPSDTNTTEAITYTQYSNAYPTAGNDRRLVIAPIIAPGTYPADTDGRILGWGKFFLKTRMFIDNGNCANNPPCGYMTVEYVGRATIGASGTVSCGSGVTTAVLYK
jgi:Flp pilus assembly protein TadG